MTETKAATLLDQASLPYTSAAPLAGVGHELWEACSGCPGGTA